MPVGHTQKACMRVIVAAAEYKPEEEEDHHWLLFIKMSEDSFVANVSQITVLNRRNTESCVKFAVFQTGILYQLMQLHIIQFYLHSPPTM